MLGFDSNDVTGSIDMNDFVASVSEMSGMPILLVRTSGMIASTNSHAEKWLGDRVATAKDRCLFDFISVEQSYALAERLITVATGTKSEVILHRDIAGTTGEWRVCLWPVRTIDGSGSLIMLTITELCDHAVQRAIMQDQIDFLENKVVRRRAVIGAFRNYVEDMNRIMTTTLETSRNLRRKSMDAATLVAHTQLESEIQLATAKWAQFPARMPSPVTRRSDQTSLASGE